MNRAHAARHRATSSGGIAPRVDPYLLNGVLIEGIASTLSGRIPEREVAAHAIHLPHERPTAWRGDLSTPGSAVWRCCAGGV
ncbi:MAG TPA: hypothetical protein VL614_31010 [Acetobacteraceae bacterium]|jgi:hypothetical protein|nr:hypothetical protein [Acetobacteraceae bacterium]